MTIDERAPRPDTPAAVPSKEEIAAFLRLRDEMVPDPDERTDEERSESALAILDLFTPILEQKERATAALLCEVAKWAGAAGEAEGRLKASETAGVVDAWQARALAAEAALAAAESLLVRAKDHIVQNADDLSMHSPAVQLVEEIAAHIGLPALNSRAIVGAAIRAKGE